MRTATAKDLRAKKPRSAVVEIVLDDELVIEHDRINELLVDARKDERADEVARLEGELVGIRERLEAETVSFVFRAVGATRYRELVDAHPPTKEQNAQSRERNGHDAPYDVDAFGPAIIAASASEPAISLEEAETIWTTWNEPERTALFVAALDVNNRAASLRTIT